MFKFFVPLALLAVVAYAGPLTRSNGHGSSPLWRSSGRIINGTETTIEENPHQISIQLKDFGHWCGGSIISKNWILTAAHCATDSASELHVLAGTANQFVGGSWHRVSKIVPHEKFDFNEGHQMVNDIALMQLEDEFVFDATRKPIDLYAKNEETIVGSVAVVTGWGETGHGYPDILNLVKIPIISKGSCGRLYKNYGGIAEGQICAAYENGGKDACQGDSGGPLTVNGRQAGVVSWGLGCALPGNPGVYTEIAHYRDWIKSHSGV